MCASYPILTSNCIENLLIILNIYDASIFKVLSFDKAFI